MTILAQTVIPKAQVDEILGKHGYKLNKTMNVKFKVGKKYKVIYDSLHFMTGKIGEVMYAEDYSCVKDKKTISHTVRILLKFDDLDDIKEQLAVLGGLGGSVKLDICEHCGNYKTKHPENCRWYYKEALEEVH